MQVLHGKKGNKAKNNTHKMVKLMVFLHNIYIPTKTRRFYGGNSIKIQNIGETKNVRK